MSGIHRAIFFTSVVRRPRWKAHMCGPNEDRAVEILTSLGYVEDVDYVRQHPFEETCVCDFAFVPEQISIEIDGKSHEPKQQRLKDESNDSYMQQQNWVVLRIKDDDMEGGRASFHKNLIKELVEDRRKQLLEGGLSLV